MAKATAPVQDPQIKVLTSAMEDLATSLGTLSTRLSEVEQSITRLSPRDSLIPTEVWASLGHEGLIGSAISGAVQGICTNSPLHNLNKHDTQEVYAKMSFDFAEKILIEYGNRLNQTVKKEETDEHYSEQHQEEVV